ncbi:MAG: DUF3291 domain-containing protein, partial [Acidimicrobiia bacterium]|nr:DUF3291 domain-containing protein [Acidimicrobiia bacterium]
MAAYDLAPVNIGRLRAPTDDPLVAEFMNGPDEVDALADHVYRSDHTGFLRRRAAWFAPMDEAIAALWWVPAGHRPTEAEAVARLDHLHHHG